MNMLAVDAALVGLPRHPCPHHPPCPDWDTGDHDMAKVVADHHEQGFICLCNGVIILDDTGEILPNGVTVPAHRPEPLHARLWDSDQPPIGGAP